MWGYPRCSIGLLGQRCPTGYFCLFRTTGSCGGFSSTSVSTPLTPDAQTRSDCAWTRVWADSHRVVLVRGDRACAAASPRRVQRCTSPCVGVTATPMPLTAMPIPQDSPSRYTSTKLTKYTHKPLWTSTHTTPDVCTRPYLPMVTTCPHKGSSLSSSLPSHCPPHLPLSLVCVLCLL